MRLMSMRITTAFLIASLASTSVTLAASRVEAVHSYSSRLPAQNVRRVVIQVPVSETTVIAVPGDEIRLEGTARREYSGDDEQKSTQRLVDGASVTMKARGRNIYIDSQINSKANWYQRSSIKFRFTLYVPENLAVELHQRDADVVVRGNVGDVDATVNVGTIKVEVPKRQVAELLAKSRIGEVTTDLPDRTVVKQGVFAGATSFLNDGGKSVLHLRLNVGRIDVSLK